MSISDLYVKELLMIQKIHRVLAYNNQLQLQCANNDQNNQNGTQYLSQLYNRLSNYQASGSMESTRLITQINGSVTGELIVSGGIGKSQFTENQRQNCSNRMTTTSRRSRSFHLFVGPREQFNPSPIPSTSNQNPAKSSNYSHNKKINLKRPAEQSLEHRYKFGNGSSMARKEITLSRKVPINVDEQCTPSTSAMIIPTNESNCDDHFDNDNNGDEQDGLLIVDVESVPESELKLEGNVSKNNNWENADKNSNEHNGVNNLNEDGGPFPPNDGLKYEMPEEEEVPIKRETEIQRKVNAKVIKEEISEEEGRSEIDEMIKTKETAEKLKLANEKVKGPKPKINGENETISKFPQKCVKNDDISKSINCAKCEWMKCGKEFENDNQLYDHIKAEHIGEQSEYEGENQNDSQQHNEEFICKWHNCDLAPRRGNLQRKYNWLLNHLIVWHTPKAETHKCLFVGCNLRFKKLQGLTNHLHSAHAESVVPKKRGRKRRVQANNENIDNSAKTQKIDDINAEIGVLMRNVLGEPKNFGLENEDE